MIGLTVMTVWLALAGVTTAGTQPAAGGQLPPMTLDSTADDVQRTYLGLSRSGPFDPRDIAGRLLVIEIFSMYCPYCQREAPAVNRLYEAIQASTRLRDQVKMIGIGVGNSAFEVDHFRKHYQIPFPLFPDEEFAIHQSLGEVRTPFFIVVDLQPDDRGRILWTAAGALEPLESLIDRLNGLLDRR